MHPSDVKCEVAGRHLNQKELKGTLNSAQKLGENTSGDMLPKSRHVAQLQQ